MLNALGGDCLEDFDRLREDLGLREMLGHEVPSPEAARKFLYQFHDEEKLVKAQRELPVGRLSYIPEESTPLRALAQVNQDLVHDIGNRGAQQKIATVDLDATVIESWKREAQATYQGGKGYQPMLALWAEMDLALADEFRDGNVPAHTELRHHAASVPELAGHRKRVLLPRRFGLLGSQLVRWLRDQKRPDGPQGLITFALSVRMTPTLKEHILRLPESAWKPYRDDAETIANVRTC